jgi:hypothetical protein
VIVEYRFSDDGLNVLYEHPSSSNRIVHASVNSDTNLLAFTVIRDDDNVYETCLAEIHPPKRVFSLGSSTTASQRIQVRTT